MFGCLKVAAGFDPLKIRDEAEAASARMKNPRKARELVNFAQGLLTSSGVSTETGTG